MTARPLPSGGVTEYLHGHRVEDPFRWLEAADDPATVAWVAEQQARFEEARDGWAERPRWRATLSELLAAELPATPVLRGGRTFTTRRPAGNEHPVLVVREGDDGPERVLLDPVRLDPSAATVLDCWEPSWEGDLLAYQLSRGGTEHGTLHVLDVAAGTPVGRPIDRVRYSSIGWLPGGREFCYVRALPGQAGDQRSYRRAVYLHRLGTDPDADPVVFGQGRDPGELYVLRTAPAGRWVAVRATAGVSRRAQLWLTDLSGTGTPRWRCLQRDVEARTRVVALPQHPDRDDVLLLTDRDAPAGRVVRVHADHPEQPWQVLIEAEPGTVLTDAVPLRRGSPDGRCGRDGILAVTLTRHAVGELHLHDASGGHRLATVTLPGAGTGAVERLSPSPDGRRAWFLHADHLTPGTLLCLDADTGQARGPVTTAPGPGVRERQVVVTSDDGTSVRVFLLIPREHPDRPRPAVLTGYGGFGASMTPGYTPQAVAWVRAGGVYAIACLRGGGEEGADWHRAGTGAGKQNTVDDLDAAARWLIDAGWTAPSRLGLLGSSNGGLVAAAAATGHPHRYRAAVCVAPLLDMVRYEQSGRGASWREEYGRAGVASEFEALLALSPYHRVRPGVRYPATLLVGFEGDTRVDPLHVRKMCARLRAAAPGQEVLLRTERGVGHGARAASRQLELFTDCFAFLADRLGLTL